jgi:hypothetical protein
MSPFGSSRVEIAAALVLTVLGIVVTTWAIFQHTGPLVAPGATLIFGGSAWLGNALARHDVPLWARRPGPRSEHEAT